MALPARGRRWRPLRSIFLAPAIVFVAIFMGYPLIQTVLFSFDNSNGQFVGLQNYSSVLDGADTVNVANLPWPPPLGTLVHNALWISIHLPLSLFAGLWLALILREVRGSSIVKSAIFLGMVTPMIVGGVILRFLLESGVGIVPAFFGLIGLQSLNINWMVNRDTVLLGLVFGSVWLWTGFSLIVYSAGLTTIPREYFEAAKIDGASTLKTFLRVTFPLLKPITLVVVTMTVLWELKIFDIVYIATGASGGPSLGPGGGAADVLALQAWRYAFIGFDFGRAAVVATILTLLTLVATVSTISYMARR